MMDESQHELAITACLNCAKRVMVVSNLKLSRNATVIASIKAVAEDILFDNITEDEDDSILLSRLKEVDFVFQNLRL